MQRAQTLILVAVGLSLSGVARADCEGVYTADEMLEDIDAMTAAIRGADSAALQVHGIELERGLPCMGAPANPHLMATVYRMLGVYHSRSDTVDQAPYWFRIARELDPTYSFDITAVTVESTTFAIYEDAQRFEGQDPVPVTGKVLNVPANSKLLIDGRPLTRAEATNDRYHLIQQVASDGGVRASWLIMGNAIPARLLRDEVVTINEAKAEEEVKAEKARDERRPRKAQELAGGYTTDETTLVRRDRPPQKTPLMVAGAATMLAAGGLYAASVPAYRSFERANTVDDLTSARALTNTLVMASGGVLVLGLGVGAWGLLLDGSPTMGVTVTW